MLERIERNLRSNRFGFSYVETRQEALELVKSMIHENDLVGVGGSVTLKECGIIDYLENREDIRFLNRKDFEDRNEMYKKSFDADVYLASTNALTMNGELYNVDGTGNRVAAMIYGPKKVIIVAGKNKIVNNVEEAIKRNEEICAIKNSTRLNKGNPCESLGYCVHCKSPNKVCRAFTLIGFNRTFERIHVILVNEDLGY